MKNKGIGDLFHFLHVHIVSIIIVVVVVAGFVSSFYILNEKTKPEEDAAETVSYKEMNTIYESMSPVKTMNPLKSNDEDVYYISQLIYSSLFKLNNTLNIKKDLVSSYETNPGSGFVELKLKKAEFSDGSAVSSYDVSFTIEEIKRIGAKSPYYNYVSKIDYVSIYDNRNLTVYFKNSKDAALDNLVFPIVSEYSYYNDSQNRILGSGQYKVTSYDGETTLKLKANENYYGNIAENKIEFKIIPDKSTTPGLMTMDSITTFVSGAPDSDVDALDKDLQVTKIPSDSMEYIAFSFKNQYLKDSRVRKAIAYGIDNKALINDNYGNMAEESESIYYPGFLGTEKTGDSFAYDPKTAAQLLSEAGYKDSNEDGYLEDKKGKILSLTILVNENDSNRRDTAATICEYLNQIGIQATVDKKNWNSYRKSIRKGKFDIYIGGYSFDKQYNLKELFVKNNSLGYDSSKALQLAGTLETCIGAKKQKSTFVKLQKVLNEDLPYYCICYKDLSFITVSHFESESVPTYFDIYRNCAKWRWKRIVVEKNNKE